MSKINEQGDAINLANFNTLKNNVATFDPVYNPARDALKPASLLTLYNSCSLAQKIATEKKVDYGRIVADRKALFDTLSPLTTRIFNVLKTSGALPQIISNVKTVADKIRGMDTRSKTTPTTEETTTTQENPPAGPDSSDEMQNDEQVAEETKKYSVSQMSFVMRAENFGKMIIMLKAEPLYQPSSDDLKIPALEALFDSLLQYNNSVSIIFPVYKKALFERNTLFYAPETGLVGIALSVKEYVKGEYGIKTQAYASIKGLRFMRKK